MTLDWRALSAAHPAAPGSVESECCCRAQQLSRLAYGAVVDTVPTPLWRVWPEAHDAWGAITAAVRAGLTEGTVLDAVPEDGGQRWYLMQGWHSLGDVELVNAGKRPQGAGHTFLVYIGRPGEKCRVLDALHTEGSRDFVPGRWLQQWSQVRLVRLREP